MEHLGEMALVGVVFLFMAVGVTYMARQSLVQTFGKHLSTQRWGAKVSEETYALDEKARRRVRWGTVVAAVIIFLCTGACFWNFATLLILRP